MTVIHDYWTWDGAAWLPRSIDLHHADEYELRPSPCRLPTAEEWADMADMATRINPAAVTIIAPDFATWGGIDPLGRRRWEADSAGICIRHRVCLIGLKWGMSPPRVLAHELLHSLWPVLRDDDRAAPIIGEWQRRLIRLGPPPEVDGKWWTGNYEEPVCLSFDCWFAGQEQPYGLPLPKPVERVASITGKVKVWERADAMLAAAVEAAAERVHEGQETLDRTWAEALPGARRQAARNAAANAADMKLAEGAEAVAQAIKGGDLATAEAALQAFEQDPTRPDLIDAVECAAVWRSLQIKPPSDDRPTPAPQPGTAPRPAPRM